MSRRSASIPNDDKLFRRRSSALNSLNSFSLRRKDPIDVVFDDQQDAAVRAYTTLERIAGHVTVRLDKDTKFTDFTITFEGRIETQATTSPHASGQIAFRHTILKLPMPISRSACPADMIFRADQPYEIPFVFVVPEKLLSQACNHGAEDSLAQIHLELPPSLGDKMVATNATGALGDDMSPQMAKVLYKIRVKIHKDRTLGGKSNPIQIAEKAVRLRIIPAKIEHSPSLLEAEQEMRIEKKVKKSSFSIGCVGRLTTDVSQPKSLQLPHPRSTDSSPISTSTTVYLRFDPCPKRPGQLPPALDNCITKLRVVTYFGAEAFNELPCRKGFDMWHRDRRFYPYSVDLSCRNISAIEWTRHESGSQLTRRQSNWSSLSENSIPDPSEIYDGGPFYTAKVVVPVSLPSSKSFVPTFYNCHIARTYILELSLTYRTPGTNITPPSISLKIPIQITSKGNPDARPSISEEEAEAIAARQALADDFPPETLPSPEYTERPPIESLGTVQQALPQAPPEYHTMSLPVETSRGPPPRMGGGLSLQASAQVMS